MPALFRSDKAASTPFDASNAINIFNALAAMVSWSHEKNELKR
jgi:hypothetical protein